MSLYALDSTDNGTVFDSEEAIALVATGPGKIYSDSSCTVPTATYKFTAYAADAVSFYVQPAAIGKGTLTVNDSGSGHLPSLNTDYQAYLVAALKITGPTMAMPGSCTKYSVATVLGSGAESSVSEDTAIHFGVSGSKAPGIIYGDDKCSSPVTSLQLAVGTSSAAFYFKQPFTCTDTLSASIPQPKAASPTANDDINGSVTVVSQDPADASSSKVCPNYPVVGR